MASRDPDDGYRRAPWRDIDDRHPHPDRDSENWGSAYAGQRALRGHAPQEQGGWARQGPGARRDDDRSAWERQHQGDHGYDYGQGGDGRQGNYGYGSDEFADDYGHRQFGDRGGGGGGGFYGNRDRFPGGRAPQRSQPQHDPDYLQWRNEQLRHLDNDYEQWRRERYQKFAEDFSTWRSQRAAQDARAAQPPQPPSAADPPAQPPGRGGEKPAGQGPTRKES